MKQNEMDHRLLTPGEGLILLCPFHVELDEVQSSGRRAVSSVAARSAGWAQALLAGSARRQLQKRNRMCGLLAATAPQV